MVESLASGLLERDDERASARALVSTTLGGSGGLLVLLGPAGIGKTRLLSVLRDEAEDAGMRVLTARGSQLERNFSFGVARQLLEPVLKEASPADRERLLGGAAHLAAALVGDAPDPASHGVGGVFQALHGLYWLTANIAEGCPVLLVVDDAHWADVSSLEFLTYLGGRLDGLPVSIACAIRTGEPDIPADFLDALSGSSAATVLRPKPLSEAATEEMIRRGLGAHPDPDFARAFHRATGGNPFLVHELVSAMRADGIEPSSLSVPIVSTIGPEAISRAVLARLARMTEGAHALAQALAVFGTEAELGDVAALASLEGDSAAEIADGLVTTEILERKQPLTFVHPVVRQAIYGEILPSLRDELHGRAARLMAERSADPETIAAHLLLTRPSSDPWTAQVLLSAGEIALGRGSPHTAANYLERACTEPPSPDNLTRTEFHLGLALLALARHGEALTRLRQAREHVLDPVVRAEMTRPLASVLLLDPATVPEAVHLLDEVIQALPESAEELGARLEGDISTASFISLEGRRAALARHPRFVDPRFPQSLAGPAMAKVLFEGPAGESANLAREALAGGRLLETETADSTTFWLAALALLYAHDLEGADAVMTQGILEATKRGSLRGVGLGACFRSRAKLLLGRLQHAEDDARRFSELLPDAFGLGPAFLVDALMEQGRIDEAERALEQAGSVSINSSMSHFLFLTRGTLHIRRGNYQTGLDQLFELARGFEGWGTATPGPIQWRPLAAEALSAVGDHERAQAMIDSEIRACRDFGAPVPMGVALRSAGTLAGGEDGLDLLGRSVSTLADTPARLERAKSLLVLGGALRRARRPADARSYLAEAMDAARRCGAFGLAERAYEELRAAGARPRKIVRSGVAALTSSERRVCEMAASGMSNRDIAQDLFVTVRTVETHLGASYRKLGVSSRTELAERLEEGS